MAPYSRCHFFCFPSTLLVVKCASCKKIEYFCERSVQTNKDLAFEEYAYEKLFTLSDSWNHPFIQHSL